MNQRPTTKDTDDRVAELVRRQHLGLEQQRINKPNRRKRRWRFVILPGS